MAEFVDDIQMYFVNGNIWSSNEIPLQFDPCGVIFN